MSNTSYSFKENSHVIVNQGGEKKVMKKILSVALSTAMAFSMFASVAFGADAKLTPEQQFNALKEAGIVSGFPDGLSHLEKTLTRAELAKIIVNSLSLEPVDATSYNDKNYANHWGRPYIEAATQAGILNGKDAVKKLFDPNGAVTVQELAKVLVTALKLEVPADANNTASAWAKGYVAAAVNAGYLADGINYQAQATRSQAVVAAYAIYEAAQFKVTKAEAIDATHVKLTLSNGETVDVTLEKPLEANKATELEYTTADGKVLKYTVTWVVTDATKVQSVEANNLKEVVVTFDGTVDKESATNKANYSIKSGKVIDHVTVSADLKSVTLYLSGALTNNKADAVTVSNVKAGANTVSAKEVAFTPVDNTLPTVESVVSLGTKSLKVIFNEPVKDLVQANFELDGKSYYGSVEVDSATNNRIAILTPYSSTALEPGEHTLTVKNVSDFNAFVGLTSEHKFTVVEDKDAPTVASASATLETVTLTFSEDVDSSSFDAGDLFWKSGDSSFAAEDFEKISDREYKFTFKGTHILPTGNVTLYVTDVTDYSGNKIADNTTVSVTPVIDETRPEVTKVTAESATKLKIVFSKAVDEGVDNVDNYTITKPDKTVVAVADAYLDSTDTTGKTVIVETYTSMNVGPNTISIKNIKDTTKLQNTMLDYTGTVTVGDVEPPTFSPIVNTEARTVVFAFSEKMDVETLTNYSNYLVSVDGVTQVLTSALADITVLQDGKAVMLSFPETYKNKTVEFAATASDTDHTAVQTVTILAVKDLAGNYLDEFTAGDADNQVAVNTDVIVEPVEYDTDKYGDELVAVTGTKQLKVKFSAPISSAPKTAFTIEGSTISSVAVDGSDVVTLNLTSSIGTDGAGLTDLKVDLSKIITVAGVKASATAINTDLLANGYVDLVAPALDKSTYASGVQTDNDNQQIIIHFDEDLTAIDPATDAALAALAATDFKVVRVADTTTLKAVDDYQIEVTGKTVKITILASTSYDSKYRVTVNGATYVKDEQGYKVIPNFTVTSDTIDGGL